MTSSLQNLLYWLEPPSGQCDSICDESPEQIHDVVFINLVAGEDYTFYFQVTSFELNSTIEAINQPTYSDDEVLYEMLDIGERHIKFQINFESGVGSFINFTFIGELSGHNATIRRPFRLVHFNEPHEKVLIQHGKNNFGCIDILNTI